MTLRPKELGSGFILKEKGKTKDSVHKLLIITAYFSYFMSYYQILSTYLLPRDCHLAGRVFFGGLDFSLHFTLAVLLQLLGFSSELQLSN